MFWCLDSAMARVALWILKKKGGGAHGGGGPSLLLVDSQTAGIKMKSVRCVLKWSSHFSESPIHHWEGGGSGIVMKLEVPWCIHSSSKYAFQPAAV